MNLYQVLRRPLITEKNIALQAFGKYAFEVAGASTKTQIKQAVEKAFNVEVTTVNVLTVHGKRRQLRNHLLPARPWKKAIVTLKAGDKIELFEGV